MGYDYVCMDMWDELVEVIKKGDPQWEPNPEVRGAFFQYTDDDEQNRREVALIGPFDPELNTITGLSLPPEIGIPRICKDGLIKTVEILIPADLSSSQTNYAKVVSCADQRRVYDLEAGGYLVACVNRAALRIAQHACPHLTPQVLWATFNRKTPGKMGYAAGVYYPEVELDGYYVALHTYWEPIDTDSEQERLESVLPKQDYFLSLLEKNYVAQDDVQEMMLGMGRQWVYARPDRFPIRHAFELDQHVRCRRCTLDLENFILPARLSVIESLPIEILLLIFAHLPLPDLLSSLYLSRTFTVRLGPLVNSLSYNFVTTMEPWLVPPPSSESEDRRWWDAQVKQELEYYGYDATVEQFPWFAYLQACRMSASMKSRARIWGVAMQMKRLAAEAGYVSPCLC